MKHLFLFVIGVLIYLSSTLTEYLPDAKVNHRYIKFWTLTVIDFVYGTTHFVIDYTWTVLNVISPVNENILLIRVLTNIDILRMDLLYQLLIICRSFKTLWNEGQFISMTIFIFIFPVLIWNTCFTNLAARFEFQLHCTLKSLCPRVPFINGGWPRLRRGNCSDDIFGLITYAFPKLDAGVANLPWLKRPL